MNLKMRKEKRREHKLFRQNCTWILLSQTWYGILAILRLKSLCLYSSLIYSNAKVEMIMVDNDRYGWEKQAFYRCKPWFRQLEWKKPWKELSNQGKKGLPHGRGSHHGQPMVVVGLPALHFSSAASFIFVIVVLLTMLCPCWVILGLRSSLQ